MGVRSHVVAILIGTLLVAATASAGAATYSDARYGDPVTVFSKGSDALSLTNQEPGMLSGPGTFQSIERIDVNQDECAPGTRLLAKYEWEDDGEGEMDFVFENGPAGDFVDIFNVQDKKAEEHEPTTFDWAVDRSVSDNKVSALTVKYGQEETAWRYEPAYNGSFEELTDDDFAISHVLFCGPIYYQIDLIEGEPGPFGSDNTYNDQERLVQAITVSATGDVTSHVSPGSANDNCIDDGDITFEASNQKATVLVSIPDDCDDLTLSLVGYELPGTDTKFVRSNADGQVLLASDMQDLTGGVDVQFEIDLDD